MLIFLILGFPSKSFEVVFLYYYYYEGEEYFHFRRLSRVDLKLSPDTWCPLFYNVDSRRYSIDLQLERKKGTSRYLILSNKHVSI